MLETVKDQIQKDIIKYPIILFMKGSRQMPLCGFSARVVAVLNDLGLTYETRDVLQDDTLRAAIKEFSNWPTLPQLFIKGEFIGGCDIVTALYEEGKLQQLCQSL